MPALRANYAAISGAFAPLWIAADRSLFAKHGLNVDLRYIKPGAEIVEAALNGEQVVYIGNSCTDRSGQCRGGHLHFTDNAQSAARGLEGSGQRHRTEYPG